MSINGFDNEYEFVKYLNGKRVCDLDFSFKEIVYSMFYNIGNDDIIKCWRNHLLQKSDILIRIGNAIRGISIKKGCKNSVHVERISDFVYFLKENNVPNCIIDKYLFYHFADGTKNGSGKVRVSSLEYKKNHQSDIDEINRYFNQKDFLERAIDRFVLKGNNSDYYISGIIYGEVNDFLWISSDDIKKIILSKKDIYSTGVHFGSLFVQPKNRCLNYNKKYIKDRFLVQIKWFSLFDNIIESMNNNVLKQVELNEKLDYFLDFVDY